MVSTEKRWKLDRRYILAIVFLVIIVPAITLITLTIIPDETLFKILSAETTNKWVYGFIKVEFFGLPFLVYMTFQKNISKITPRVVLVSISIGWAVFFVGLWMFYVLILLHNGPPYKS